MSPSSPSPVAVDPFVRDRLPARAQWPQLRYDLPELQIPDRVNLVERLLDGAVAKGWGARPMLRSPKIVLTYADAKERVDRIAQVLVEDLKLRPGQRVLLIDDLIATGGTLMAGRNLLEKLGATVMEGAAIVDLPELGGSARIRASGLPLFTLVEFEGH